MGNDPFNSWVMSLLVKWGSAIAREGMAIASACAQGKDAI